MNELTPAAFAVLRALARFRNRAVSGEELMERIFATTSEVPLDPPKVNAAVAELQARSFVRADVDHGRRDPEFDFVSVAITADGQAHLTG